MANGKIKAFGNLIFEWLSQFATTYNGALPDGVQPDNLYILMSNYYENFAEQFIFPIQIYNRKTTSYLGVINLSDKIEEKIGEGGLRVQSDSGLIIKIDKGSPFYQNKQDEDSTLRAGYINLNITIY